MSWLSGRVSRETQLGLLDVTVLKEPPRKLIDLSAPQMAGCIPHVSDIYPVPAAGGPLAIDKSKKRGLALRN